ncbi:MAG: hypothetical protein A4S16_11005 [Proteobacteria bacterium SG_bin6]|nr:MAG: hypothetical protein A4S16_11005 [Proteobacteria bacterium SG_bin6]
MRRGAWLPALLAACTPAAPAGQVVARVDGTEITERELRAEAAAAGADAATPATRGQLIARLIDRKLAAQAARRARLDRDPALQLAMRRGTEQMLAEALYDGFQRAVPAPGADAVARFIAANPQRFAARTGYLVDRLVAPGPAAEGVTLDAVAARMRAQGLGFARGRAMIDSDALGPADAQALAALPPDRLLRLRVGATTLVIAVLARWSISDPLDEQRRRGRALLMEAARTAAVARLRAELRASAVIQLR